MTFCLPPPPFSLPGGRSRPTADVGTPPHRALPGGPEPMAPRRSFRLGLQFADGTRVIGQHGDSGLSGDAGPAASCGPFSAAAARVPASGAGGYGRCRPPGRWSSSANGRSRSAPEDPRWPRRPADPGRGRPQHPAPGPEQKADGCPTIPAQSSMQLTVNSIDGHLPWLPWPNRTRTTPWPNPGPWRDRTRRVHQSPDGLRAIGVVVYAGGPGNGWNCTPSASMTCPGTARPCWPGSPPPAGRGRTCPPGWASPSRPSARRSRSLPAAGVSGEEHRFWPTAGGSP